MNSRPVYAQYSSPGLWVENGVWFSASSGYSTPLADPMAAYHGSGFMINGAVEFQGAFVNYGVDGGMHIFAETPRHSETIIYPACAFVTFNLVKIFSNNSRVNRDKQALYLRSGLGAGLYTHLTWEVTQIFGGGYVPLELSYQYHHLRAAAEFRFHEVFGVISAQEGTSQYGTFGVTLEYFLPL